MMIFAKLCTKLYLKLDFTIWVFDWNNFKELELQDPYPANIKQKNGIEDL